MDVGNTGTADDAGAGGGIYSGPYGRVNYAYRMGTYEISQDAITRATASGLANVVAGAHTGAKPAAYMTWYEAAAFVNWLNDQRTPGLKAYNLNGTATALTLWSSGDAWQLGGENLYRHKDAYYFLPSEDEWYKAAYHKNDGVTANYWDYATGSNSIPDGIDFNGDTAFDAVFNQGFDQVSPNVVTNVGLGSPYGTFGQNGNVFEWPESAFTAPNDNSSEFRVIRGGYWSSPESFLRSSDRPGNDPASQDVYVGFRVASVVPEPSSAVSLLLGLGVLASRRNRQARAGGHE